MEPLRDYRCRVDNKLLLRAQLIDAEVEIKCRGCSTINRFQAKDGVDPRYACYKAECINRVVEKKLE